MIVCVDTNVLVRAFVMDDKKQGAAAARILRESAGVGVPLAAVCEMTWVLRSVYGFDKSQIAAVLEEMLRTPNLLLDVGAMSAGLRTLKRNGEFSDGAIAFDGRRMSGGTFVSFDKRAVALVAETQDVLLLV